jgi:hypothetical protein
MPLPWRSCVGILRWTGRRSAVRAQRAPPRDMIGEPPETVSRPIRRRTAPDRTSTVAKAHFSVESATGAPRSMKMGTIASPWHYDVALNTAPQCTNLFQTRRWFCDGRAAGDAVAPSHLIQALDEKTIALHYRAAARGSRRSRIVGRVACAVAHSVTIISSSVVS